MTKLKHQSKRIGTRRRENIKKRIRDHNKKLKKIDNKSKSNGIKKKSKKEIIIPNKFPLKEELLNMAVEVKKEKLEEIKRKKEKRRVDKASKSLQELKQDADTKQNKYEILQDMTTGDAINGKLSTKDFYGELSKVIQQADVIIEVLDARDPLGTRSLHVEKLVHATGKHKKLILVLNKIDLIPKETIKAWLEYLRNEYPTVAFKSSTQNQKSNLSQSNVPIEFATDNLINSSTCLGANILMKLLKNYCRNEGITQAISVGIVGLPNTGKSSLINSLKRSVVCASGATPGLTRNLQEIKLDKHIKLIDSPGIIMSHDTNTINLSLKNCLRVETLKDPVQPVEAILLKCKKQDLILKYCVSEFTNAHEFLDLVARRMGKFKKGGVSNINAAAKEVLKDWNSGKLSYYTSPPPRDTSNLQTQIVTEAAKPFDIDSIINDENELLGRIDDRKIKLNAFQIKSDGPLDDTEMQADDQNDNDTNDERDEDMQEEDEEESESESDEDKHVKSGLQHMKKRLQQYKSKKSIKKKASKSGRKSKR